MLTLYFYISFFYEFSAQYLFNFKLFINEFYENNNF